MALSPIARYHDHQARRDMTTSALALYAALVRLVTSLDKYIHFVHIVRYDV
jgi:hypothetical protein